MAISVQRLGIVLSGPHAGLKHLTDPQQNRFSAGTVARLPYPGGIAMDVMHRNFDGVVPRVMVACYGDIGPLQNYYRFVNVTASARRLSYFVEEQPLGTAGAVRAIVMREGLAEDDLVVIQAANTPGGIPLEDAVQKHLDSNASVTAIVSPISMAAASNYGTVLPAGDIARNYHNYLEKLKGTVDRDRLRATYDQLVRHFRSDVPSGDMFKVDSFLEKAPSELVPSPFAYVGTVIANAKVFSDLSLKDHTHITRGLFQALLESPEYSGRFLAYVWGGHWVNIGSTAGYWYSLMDALDGKIPGLFGGFPDDTLSDIAPTARLLRDGDREVEIKPPIHIGKNTIIEPGCVIGPNVWLGENVKVGAGSRLHDHVYAEDNSKFGKESKVGPHVYVGAHWEIGDSARVIGSALLPPIRLHNGDTVRIVDSDLLIRNSIVCGGRVMEHKDSNIAFLDQQIGPGSVRPRSVDLHLHPGHSLRRIYGATETPPVEDPIPDAE